MGLRGQRGGGGEALSIGRWRSQGAKNSLVSVGEGNWKNIPRVGVNVWASPALGLHSKHVQVRSGMG